MLLPETGERERTRALVDCLLTVGARKKNRLCVVESTQSKKPRGHESEKVYRSSAERYTSTNFTVVVEEEKKQRAKASKYLSTFCR